MASLPRRRRRRPGGMGMGQYAQYPGMMSNATPSFAGPEYYGQMLNRPPQDWSRFMPSNFQLAEGGGMHYNMNPYGYGSGGGSGWGGGFGGGGGFPGGGGMFPGWPPGGGGGTGGGGGGTTDTGGGKWIMTPDGQWIPRDSDYAEGLRGDGRLHHKGHYDQDGNYVGAEGNSYDAQGFEIDQQGRRTGGYINDSLGIGNKILGWMGADSAEEQRARAIMAEADMDVTRSVGEGTQGKYGAGGYSGQNTPSGPTQDTQAGVMPGATINWGGPPGASWGDFSAPNTQAAGPPGASFNDFNTPNDPFGSASGLAAANAAAQAAAAQEAQAMAALENWGGGMGFLGGGYDEREGADPDVDGDRGQGGSGMGGAGGGPGQW